MSMEPLEEHLEEQLEGLIREHGLWEHRDTIMATARPAIFMRLGEPGAGRTGESRIGGMPDLPDSVPWPTEPSGVRKLSFLLQIDFAELPTFAGSPFPRRGMLYLFAGEGGDGPEQVVAYTGSEPLQPRSPSGGEPFATDWYEDLAPHRLAFELSPDIPRWATDGVSEECVRYRIKRAGLSRIYGSLAA